MAVSRCLIVDVARNAGRPQISPRRYAPVPSSNFDLPLTLQHLHMHPSRKISKLKAISIKRIPFYLSYFCLVTA
jgi:hypothetical protein